MAKFLRQGVLTVGVIPGYVLSQYIASSPALQETGFVVIPPQYTVDFSITRAALGGTQYATFKIKNLGVQIRNQIYKDPYALTEYLAVQFQAGYVGDASLATCFNGFILSAGSYRQGQDFITEIQAYDGGPAMANGFYNQVVASGATYAQAITKLAKSLPNFGGQVYVGAFNKTFPRGRSLMGNTWNVILELTDGLAYIDNGNVVALNYNEALQAPLQQIDSSSGLLGSPKRTATGIELDILFEPRLVVGQYVSLVSTTNPIYNGVYKVQGFTHRGTISPAVAGDAITTVELFVGTAGALAISQTASPSGQFTIVPPS